MAFNATLAYRPLRPSTQIYNPLTGEAGTLGFFGTTDGTDTWMISCHHVLVGAGAGPQPIYQPSDTPGSAPVAEMIGTRFDVAADVAAARVLPGIGTLNEIPGIGIISPIIAVPLVGMRVIKVGAKTGLTEGEIRAVWADKIRIEVPADFPLRYEVSRAGDSGSVWVDVATRQPVGLHYQGDPVNAAFAHARPLHMVLKLIDLNMR